jgi:hypothetical protein
MEVSNQIHVPAALPTAKEACIHGNLDGWSSELVQMLQRREMFRPLALSDCHSLLTSLSSNHYTDFTIFHLILHLTRVQRYLSSKLLCQQMHSLLKHKMLQLTLKIPLYMAPTCFGPLGPSSGSIRQNLAKVTVFVEIISKSTMLKLLLCSGNMCCVYWVLCGV